MVPVFLSVVGFGLSFWVGMDRLGHSAGDVLWAIVASQICAGIALPATLYSQRSPKLRFLVKGPLRSWIALLTLAIGGIMLVCPWLRDPAKMAWMFFPLLLGIGVMLLVYGPIQDRVLRKAVSRKRSADS